MVKNDTRHRLQKALRDLSRTSRAGGGSRRRLAVVPPSKPRTAAPAPPEPVFEPSASVETGDVLHKLDRIERMLSEMKAPNSETSEVFVRWVKQGYWVHIRFGDFLQLERSGRV